MGADSKPPVALRGPRRGGRIREGLQLALNSVIHYGLRSKQPFFFVTLYKSSKRLTLFVSITQHG